MYGIFIYWLSFMVKNVNIPVPTGSLMGMVPALDLRVGSTNVKFQGCKVIYHEPPKP